MTNTKRNQEHARLVAQMQNQAAMALAASRRPLLEQSSDVPTASPSRQRADRILLLAALQGDSGRFDHARSERMLECCREIASSLVRAPPGDFPHLPADAAQLRAFDIAVALYLAHLLAGAATTVVDAENYSLRWHTLLLLAHTHLMKVAFQARDAAPSTRTREHTTSPQLLFRDTDPVPQAEQLAQMHDRYTVLPAHPESRFRCVLAPLLLIVIGPDGQRRDIDLAGLIHESDELPGGSEHGPLLVDSSTTPTVSYTDRRGQAHDLVYNPTTLRYERLAARTAAVILG